jgi:TRAP-type uncharacterized transport system substrate-binding protein
MDVVHLKSSGLGCTVCPMIAERVGKRAQSSRGAAPAQDDLKDLRALLKVLATLPLHFLQQTLINREILIGLTLVESSSDLVGRQINTKPPGSGNQNHFKIIID